MVLLRLFDYQGALTVRYHRLRSFYRRRLFAAYIETFNADAATKEEITDELVIALFIEEITNAVTNFYSEYYSGEIAVYDYEIAIVDIGKKEPGFISVKFGVTPQVGAHNPLGT